VTTGERLCPSAPLEAATHLLGVVGPEGRIRYVSPPLPVTESFAAAAREGRAPEKRFRFGGPCLEGDCVQWTGERCAVADRLVDAAERVMDAAHAPVRPCAVRRTCRWFHQRGANACRVCPYVVTDTVPEQA
jgi:hypothetical protein